MINIDTITRYLRSLSGVRAALLVGSRADPSARVDALSDYDIELYVSELAPFLAGDEWLKPLGDILVKWPLLPERNETGGITRLCLFEKGHRIDFQIATAPPPLSDTADHGYRVLIADEGFTSKPPAPTHTAHLVKPPDETTFRMLVNEFWWDATYVPKYLARDELPMAKWMMETALRGEYLFRIISWHLGYANNWTVNVGLHGRHFKKLMQPELWAAYEATHAGADLADNWAAFYRTVALFTELARGLARELGYAFSEEKAERMVNYFREVEQMRRP